MLFFRPHHSFLAIACLAAISFLAGCRERVAKELPVTIAPDGRKLKQLVLQTDWLAQPEHGGFYQALVKGYYRDVGLDVEIRQGGPNLASIPLVALGEAQVGLQRSDEIAIATARGIPVMILGATMQHDPQALVFHQESKIRSFKDLDGRNIMALPGSVFIPLMEKKFGIHVSVTPLDYGLSRFLSDPAWVQQCFITNEPFYLEQKGAHVGTLLLSGTGFAPYRVWFASREFAQVHPEELRTFTAASIRGWRDYLEGDHALADQKIMEQNRQMSPEFIAFSIDAMKKNHLVDGDASANETYGQIRSARLAEEIRQLSEIHGLDQPVTVSQIFDPSFLPADAR